MANIWGPNWDGINPDSIEVLDIYKPEVQVEFTWTINSNDLGVWWKLDVSDEWIAEYGLKKVLIWSQMENLDIRFDKTYVKWEDKTFVSFTAFNNGANINGTQARVVFFIPKVFFLLGHCDFSISRNGTTWVTVSNWNTPPQRPLPSRIEANRVVQLVDFKVSSN